LKYTSGEIVELGDIVKVSTPEGHSEARVVMLGETYEHLDIGIYRDAHFLEK
jgi:hypothetical protein